MPHQNSDTATPRRWARSICCLAASTGQSPVRASTSSARTRMMPPSRSMPGGREFADTQANSRTCFETRRSSPGSGMHIRTRSCTRHSCCPRDGVAHWRPRRSTSSTRRPGRHCPLRSRRCATVSPRRSKRKCATSWRSTTRVGRPARDAANASARPRPAASLRATAGTASTNPRREIARSTQNTPRPISCPMAQGALTQKPWRRPIFPKGCPLSIFGAGELNCRVRYGNGCGLSARVTRVSCV